MGRTVVSAPETATIFDTWGFSPATRSGEFVFLGGQVGIRADGSASADPAIQIEQAFENMGYILNAAGGTFSDIVDLTAFYTNYQEHGRLARPIRDKFFGGDVPPNWTAVGVAALAEPFVFEVKAIARIPDQV